MRLYRRYDGHSLSPLAICMLGPRDISCWQDKYRRHLLVESIQQIQDTFIDTADTADIYWYSRYSRYRTRLLIQQIQETSTGIVDTGPIY